jgi:glycosyltransferase involved in cell wall biosynthesis
MKKEDSGLVRSTLEIVKYEERFGHGVCVKQPSEDMPLYGIDKEVDIHSIHSQLNPKAYHDNKPKIMWMHGEPLGSIANGVSMKAILELAPVVDAFICMREAEVPIWQSIKRTYRVPKGIDLEEFKPIDGYIEKLSGEPSVLYIENWRGHRNPLYLCVAMQQVFKKYPNARLHLYNARDKKMLEIFKMLINHNKWVTFVRSINGPVKDVNELYNKVDMVVSCLDPLYARGIEAFGAGKAFIGPGYKEYDYPYQCSYDPMSMADAIMKCWDEYGKVDFRKWAEEHHDVKESVRQALEIYERYL